MKKWHEKLTKFFCIMNPYGTPGVQTFDAKKMVEMFVKAEINQVCWEDPRGFYNSKYVGKYPGIGERDLMRELAEECHKKGIKFIAAIGSFFEFDPERGFLSYEPKYPEWSLTNKDGEIGSGIIKCPNSPYREELWKILKEVIQMPWIDGFWLDMPTWNVEFGTKNIGIACYCKYCRTKFKEKYGEDIPMKQDWRNSVWRKFIRWRYEVLNEWFKETYERTKSIRMDFVFQTNYFPYAAVRAHSTDVVPKYQDVLSIEAFWEWGTYWMCGLRAKLGRAAGREKKPVGIILHVHHFWHDQIAAFMNRTIPEMKLVVSDTIANGGMPQIWGQGAACLRPNWTYYGLSVVKPCYEDLDKIEDFLMDTQSLKYTALLYSQQTRDFYAFKTTPEIWTLNKPEDAIWDFYRGTWREYFSEFEKEIGKNWGLHIIGAYKAFLEEHVPFDLVVDGQLNYDDLSKYRVLILPNAVCLSNEQLEAIRRFVKNGGGLVATYKTSLADEEGVLRKDFGLSDVFGISLKGSSEKEGRLWTYIKIKKSHPIVEGIDPELALGHKREHLYVEAAQTSEALATIAYPVEALKGFFAGIEMPSEPGSETDFPAIITSQYGKGRVVYFAGQIDLLNGLWGLPEYSKFLANAAKWAAGGIAVETNAPTSVELTVFTQPEKRRTIIHLVNFTGAYQWTSSNIPSANQVKEIIPIRNVKIRLKKPTSEKVLRVYEAYDKKDLKWKENDKEFISFEVPKLDIHQIIVVEQ